MWKATSQQITQEIGLQELASLTVPCMAFVHSFMTWMSFCSITFHTIEMFVRYTRTTYAYDGTCSCFFFFFWGGHTFLPELCPPPPSYAYMTSPLSFLSLQWTIDIFNVWLFRRQAIYPCLDRCYWSTSSDYSRRLKYTSVDFHFSF